MMNFRSNILAKKAWRYYSRIPRHWHRSKSTESTYREYPPVLVNSFPKSGTHLLVQILGVLPSMRDWGDFWASQPSFTFREIEDSKMASRISKVAPNELVCGHLFHGKAVAAAIRSRNVAHFYIYRDPRDVVVSEAHYLANMNSWHKLHKNFSSLSTQSERILLSINGLEGSDLYYPNIAERFQRFSAWLKNPDVCAIKYEDLVSNKREECIREILEFYRKHANAQFNVDELVPKAIDAIDPKRSHTFRRGGSGGWSREFDGACQDSFKEVAGSLLVEIGYEESLDW